MGERPTRRAARVTVRRAILERFAPGPERRAWLRWLDAASATQFSRSLTTSGSSRPNAAGYQRDRHSFTGGPTRRRTTSLHGREDPVSKFNHGGLAVDLMWFFQKKRPL